MICYDKRYVELLKARIPGKEKKEISYLFLFCSILLMFILILNLIL
ncbi:hypothetical protein JXA85_07610 [Candidatus Woesearchaeota archaeon]|nr:hypothetical protein [Candidatus Woesearchaeota archaeon]